jgi:diadenosine tetraphosphate (Ap4A) HIT family hydrolase
MMRLIFRRFKIIGFAVFFALFAMGAIPLWAVENAQEKRGIVDYEQLKIKSYKYWDLDLHENQCYLGRAFVQLKEAEGVDDFLAIDGDVRDEFFLIGQEMKAALKTLFKPDKMNYAALSNTSSVIHVHIVPRYKESREFAGLIFKDSRWGQNYAPYDKSFVIDQDVLFQIRDAIKEQL